MDKIAKVPHLREELDWLDQTYGVEKEGFFHQEHWQLLVAIMLSAQSTDKQVDEVLPKLYGRFPTVQEIAQATEEEIGEEIKSVGLYKSKAKHVKSCCMQLAEQYGGEVPTTMSEYIEQMRKWYDTSITVGSDSTFEHEITCLGLNAALSIGQYFFLVHF